VDQIGDASRIDRPHQHNSEDAKFTKAKPREDGSFPTVDLAIPTFGYQTGKPTAAATR
jgi:hypothetical protein